MKRKFAIFMVMLLAFALLISTTTITVSAETTYTPIGGSATFAKKLVVNSDTNIPNITFSYTIRRANAIAATASTVEILEANRAGNVETDVYTNNDTAGAIFGLSTDTDLSAPTVGKKYAQKTVSVNFLDDTFTKPGVYRYIITETTTPALPGVVYDENPISVTTEDNSTNQWLHLAELSELTQKDYITYYADKVSVSILSRSLLEMYC